MSDRLPPRICEFSGRSQTFVVSVPDFALADRVLKIQNGRHETQNTRDKYSKRMRGMMRGLPVRHQLQALPILWPLHSFFFFLQNKRHPLKIMLTLLSLDFGAL